MNSRFVFASIAVVVLGLVCVSGCRRGPARVSPPSISASSAGAAALAAYDADHDGKISGSELDRCGALKAALKQIDADGDGAITADEITARIECWQETKIGRMALGCTVTHNGRPLQNAEVLFVRETFLGTDVKTAKGTTDENGLAMISVEGSTPPGAAPGLYRVEVTKSGENIPARYNTQSILGQEVAVDAANILSGVVFHLKY